MGALGASMKCPDCGHEPMDLIEPTVTYQGVLLGRYRMNACPACKVQLLLPAAAQTMRKKVEAEIRAKRLRTVPKLLSQVMPQSEP